MNYTDIRSWTDEQVEHIIHGKCIEVCCSGIRAVHNPIITMDEGIEVIADVLELPVEERYKADDRYPYFYKMTYKNVEFCQVSKTPLQIERKVTITC